VKGMFSEFDPSFLKQLRRQIGFSDSSSPALAENAGYLTPKAAELDDEHSCVSVAHAVGAFVNDLDSAARRKHAWLDRDDSSWFCHLPCAVQPIFALHHTGFIWLKRNCCKRQDVSGIAPHHPVLLAFVFMPPRGIEGYVLNHFGPRL